MSANHQLNQLLLEQRKHDEIAHRDVYYLGSAKRLSHLAHHFAKYVGRLARFPRDTDTLEKTIVDTFIVALSAAELLRLDVGAEICTDSLQASSLKDLGAALAPQTSHRTDIGEWFFLRLAGATGVCAKAVESLDHLEAFDYRARIEQAVLEILRSCVATAAVGSLDLGKAVRLRWQELEARAALPNTG